ncbi:AimR family lysis-lysogeny pheromone receptor [Bacillus subtilis]|uniref:AimR family lysis-lysogeny pheromone receptor n=1 Tax=Bacillus subtilis TaxID=1423 RepID=UPI00129D3495|nr:AimR family lysis-lysogeny pheromone receptor [Bacillus subtilis]QGI00183.1 hypothetical protein GII77_06795 [Bacillus subtilis]
MDYIIKEIGDFIEDNDQIKKAYVRQYVGMKESSYRDFFKKGKISFRKLIRFAQLLAENTNKSSREIMSTWCLHVTGTENIKNSFEYAAITSNINLLSNLLNINKDSDGVIKQAVDIYTILYKYMTGSLSGFKLRDEVNSLHHITNKPLLILMKIMCQFTTYFEGDIQKMTSELDVIQQEALSLGERETFFKECLLFRVCELFGPVCLYLNDTDSARHFAESIIHANISAKKKSDAYYVIGMTYLSEDKDKCLYNLRTSYELMRETGDMQYIQEAKFNLDFAKVFHGITLDEDSNMRLRAYQNARRGKISLEKLKEVLEKGERDNFLLFFENTAEKSIDVMYNCLESFFCNENFFFAKLVAKELEKAGEDSRALRPFLKFKKVIKGEVLFEKDFINSFNNRSSNRVCS